MISIYPEPKVFKRESKFKRLLKFLHKNIGAGKTNPQDIFIKFVKNILTNDVKYDILDKL